MPTQTLYSCSRTPHCFKSDKSHALTVNELIAAAEKRVRGPYLYSVIKPCFICHIYLQQQHFDQMTSCARRSAKMEVDRNRLLLQLWVSFPWWSHFRKSETFLKTLWRSMGSSSCLWLIPRCCTTFYMQLCSVVSRCRPSTSFQFLMQTNV